MLKRSICLVLFMLLLLYSGSYAQAVSPAAKIKIDVKTFTLDNGMLFLVVERPTTPQVACRIAIRAGSALEDAGKTGIAHMLEHMMFKGTKNFGALDFEKDQKLQAQIESAYQAVLEEKNKRNPDRGRIKKKLEDMDDLRREVQKNFVPQAFSAQLGKNGATGVNAFTTKDQTQYIMSVPSDMVEQWFSIVSEQLFEPAWREFYVEKEVIQREWAYRYINNPGGAAWLDLEAAAYSAHPYRNPVIGWKADMDNFNTRDAIEFHKRYYNPTNAVAVLVGDITVEQAQKLARIYFERYPAGQRSPERVTAEPPQQGPRRSIRYLKGARTPVVRIGFHGARMGTPDFYALDALTMVLSQGRSARLTQQIVNLGLAVNAWAYNPDNRYGGMVILGGSPNETQPRQDLSEQDQRRAHLESCEALEKLLLAEIEKMRTDLVSPQEINRILKLNQHDFLERLRSNEKLAGTLATLEVQTGWRYLTTYLEKISEVTPEDIRRAAQKYLRPDRRTSIYVIPGGTPDQPPENYTEVRSSSGSAAANLTMPDNFSNHSIYPTPDGWKHPLSFLRRPAKVNYPPAGRFKIDQATVFYLPDPELPLVDLTILLKAGAVDVDADKIGLDQILNSSIIRGGTAGYTPAQLASVLDENALAISVSVHEEETRLKMSVMKPDWGKGLEILAEIITRPRLDPEVFKVVKNQALIALRRANEDADSVSMREAIRWHFPDHPYGRNPLDGLKTIPKISREDLLQFISAYFVPANMVVAVSGDISKEEAVSGLERFFKKLPHGQVPARKLAEPIQNSPVIKLIHKPGQVQAQVSLVLPGIKRTHPDYWKVNLLTSIFGGDDSLLYTRLRDDLGLVYTAWFYQTYRWKAGLLLGQIGCKSDRTREALTETLAIMRALKKDIPESTFKQKKLDALNSFIFNVDTPHALVETYGLYYMRNEPLDTLDKIQEAFIQASREELVQLARMYLNPEAIQIVVVADRSTRVNSALTLEEDLNTLAKKLGLPFRSVEL